MLAGCLWTGDAHDLLGYTSCQLVFFYFHADHPGLFPAPVCRRDKTSNWYGLINILSITRQSTSVCMYLPNYSFPNISLAHNYAYRGKWNGRLSMFLLTCTQL